MLFTTTETLYLDKEKRKYNELKRREKRERKGVREVMLLGICHEMLCYLWTITSHHS